MTTLTFSLSGSAIVNGSKAYTLTDADLQRLLNAMVVVLQLDPASTNAQILLAWVQEMVNRTVNLVKQEETTSAINSAQAGVTPIGMT